MISTLMYAYIVLLVIIIGSRNYFFGILNRQISKVAITQQEHKLILCYLVANLFLLALGMIATTSAMLSTAKMAFAAIKGGTTEIFLPMFVALGIILISLILWYKFVMKPLFTKLDEIKQNNKTSN